MRRRIRTRPELPGPREAEGTLWDRKVIPPLPQGHGAPPTKDVARGFEASRGPQRPIPPSEYGGAERRRQNLLPYYSFADAGETFAGWVFKLIGWAILILFFVVWVIDSGRS